MSGALVGGVAGWRWTVWPLGTAAGMPEKRDWAWLLVLGPVGLGEPWEGRATMMGSYLGGLLSGCEAVVCLVPEGGSIVESKFFIEEDVS